MTDESAMRIDKLWDVIIVGGGPAGLNAALVLGRWQRTAAATTRAPDSHSS